MYTADLELCKELSELSGWDNTEYVWAIGEPDGDNTPTEYFVYLDDHGDHRSIRQSVQRGKYWDDAISAYDAGYLLRKLPRTSLTRADGKKHNVYYADSFELLDKNRRPISFSADTPENALCKLAIELIKQGVLNPKGEA